MKKYIVYSGFLFLLLASSNSVEALWYGTTTVAKAANGVTRCSPDAHPLHTDAAGPTPADAGFPGINPNGVSYPDGQTRVSADNGGTIDCQKWDSTAPNFAANNFDVAWKNVLVPILLGVIDTGGSGLNGPTVKYRWDNADCVGGGTVFANGNTIDVSMNTAVAQGNHTLYLCARDIAGNTNTATFSPYKYDNTIPINGAITYPNGWSKVSTIPITVNASDPASAAAEPLSGVAQYEIEMTYSDDRPAFVGGWQLWANIRTEATTAGSYTYNYPANIASTPGRAYRFRFRTTDAAGNVNAYTENAGLIYKFDNVDPDPNQFNPIAPTANGSHLIATLVKNFVFNYTETSSPVSITGNFEQNGNPAATDVIGPLAFGTYNFNRDISNVNTDVGGNGGRNITFTITNITDEAGNSIAPAKVLNWYVYADKDNAVTSPVAFGGPFVADGQQHTWNISLVDQFLNPVIRATGITREVNLTLTNITNTMFLNQYARGGGTSVFVSTDSYGQQGLNPGAGQDLGNQTETTGVYPIHLKLFTPTGDSGGAHISDPNADFSFQPVFTITDTLTAAKVTPPVASPNFIFTPLFTTNIAGDLVNGGFIEGVQQNSNISVLQHPSGIIGTLGSASVYLDFSGALASISNFDFSANSGIPATLHPYGTLTEFTVSPGFPGATNLNTRLTQKATAVATPTSDLVLSSHLSYVLDTKSVVTNSYTIGRVGGYHGGVVGGLGTQVGVKILGSVSGKNVSELFTDQFISGVSMFDNVNRSQLRQTVRKNVAIAVRNMTGIAITPTISDVAAVPAALAGGATGFIISPNPGESILYIEDDGGVINLTASSVSGIRTVVVKGAHLYIQNDLTYAAAGNNILGVVVMKNDAGQGGNLYIDPGITNIVGTYVIDGSIISYNGTELGYSSSISVLKNQLYLFGSIVSENTIGGSKQNPPVCPSMITCGIPPITMEMAQKYDLNYLRRYYIYNGEPFGGAKIIGGETCPGGACTTVSSLPQKFTSISDPLAKHPVIIEFNPNIINTQPIGFENLLE